MAEKEIHLSGNDIYMTSRSEEAYRVDSGRVLVFIIPVRSQKAGRRYLLHEAGAGEVIPSLCYRGIGTGEEEAVWQFGLVPLEEAVMSTVANDEACKEAFAIVTSLRDWEEIGFEESVAECYRLNTTRDLRNLYTTDEESRNAYSRSLQLIYGLFHKDKAGRHSGREKELTGNALYDVVSYLCSWQKIDVASFDVVRATSGRRFTVRDIARVSNFTSRDLILDERWYKRDAGPILAYYGKSKTPVACVPRNNKKYRMWNPKTGESVPVTDEIAAQINPRAVMFYRPLPNKALSLRDLVLFALQDVGIRDIVNVLLFTFLGTLIGLLLPYLNEKMYDIFIPLGDLSGLRGVCAVVLACSLGNITFTVVKNLANFRAMNRMKYTLQAAVFDRLFNLPESFFRQYDSAELAERAMGISQVFSVLVNTVVQVGLSAVFSLMYLWKMFGYSSKLSWFSLLLLAVEAALILFLGWRQIRFEREKLELDGKISSLMYQLLSGVSKLRIAGAEDRGLYEYMKKYSKSCDINFKKEWYTRVSTVLTTSMTTVFSMVLYYIMIHNSLGLSMGAFIAFTSAFGSFSGAIMQVVTSALQINDIFPAFERMKPILEELPEQEEDLVMPGDLEGAIELNNVTFAYNEDGPNVLKDISVSIQSGEYVGIVGASGCGKSTLLKILLGFEKPQSGKVYYDGIDIDILDKRELRKKFGVVLQNGGLIPGSIYDNITITTTGATMDQVQQAVHDAGLENDIKEMPMGLHTILSEGDGSISGGQKQRVLIARAIVGKPRILYFDEATSALDNATQAAVCESLEKLHSTRVVIAHRLSTIIHCDRIIVMDDGRIVEMGSFDELMAKRGRFYDLASRQMA